MRTYLLLFLVFALAGPAYSADTASQIEAIKGLNARIKKENALITQVNAAVNARNWQEVETKSKQLTAMNPDRWEYHRTLADAEISLGKYREAVDAYEKAIGSARKSDGTESDAAKAKTREAVSAMFVNEGNAYLKMRKNDEAIAAYSKAAELSDKPGTAYFNICATQYNSGNIEGAIKACDKAIQYDPNKADAYFIKGSCMFGTATLDHQGKLVVPAGTAETLKKYLELAPDGGHAADVKEMLKMI
ncbi:MAG TPA: tetratricopeptide repeat protein [Geobacteraceae bacterium]